MNMLSLASYADAATRLVTLHDDLLSFDEALVFPDCNKDNGEQVRTIEQARIVLIEAERVIQEQEKQIRRLENLVQVDALTGLANRRGLMLALGRELAMARRKKNVTGLLLLIQLDDFKSVNDRWGSVAVEPYLQSAAAVLQNSVRPSDIVARVGRDAFAVVMPWIGVKAGHARAASLEETFNSRVMHWKDIPVPLHGSFGFSIYGSGDTPEAVLAAAESVRLAKKRDG